MVLAFRLRSGKRCSTRSLPPSQLVRALGLGLSISHDIIVKQHSGFIEVNTEPGQFTEFRIILPRSAA